MILNRDHRLDPAPINAAVQECVESCYHSLQPQAALARYAAGLRADPGWREAEVREFERKARRMLGELLNA